MLWNINCYGFTANSVIVLIPLPPSLMVLSLWLLECSGRLWWEWKCFAPRLSTSPVVSELPRRVNFPATQQNTAVIYLITVYDNAKCIKMFKACFLIKNLGKNKTNFIGPYTPMMVEGQPPRSSVRRSSPSPEKLPNEKVLRVGETSRWSSCIRKGTPIRRCRFFPVWWNGMEPFLSRSSLRFLNWKTRV